MTNMKVILSLLKLLVDSALFFLIILHHPCSLHPHKVICSFFSILDESNFGEWRKSCSELRGLELVLLLLIFFHCLDF